MSEFSQNKDFNVEWLETPMSCALFCDAEGRRCSLADSYTSYKTEIIFGVVENYQRQMRLRIENIQEILEPLRDFVGSGQPPQIKIFTDRNRNECVLRPGKKAETIELGIVSAVMHELDDWTMFDKIHNSLMTLSRDQLEELLPNINSFIAHGSIRPDFASDWRNFEF